MQAEIKNGNLIITVPLNNPPKPSSTGRNLMLASSGGNRPTTAQVNGKPVVIGLNAYISNR